MSGPKILIADDDLRYAAALATRIEHAGYRVVMAQTGFEALMVALEHHPDLFILDVNMPMGNGFSIRDRLEKVECRGACPIIFVSGESVDWLEEVAMTHGAVAFFRKPVDHKALLQTIAESLGLDKRTAA
ncbi:MAG: response regulator [Phycisphaerales bacterium]